ncbi:MAG: hypothetical protein ABFD49_04095 [Armatimonadota bacterium]|nr:hypothetical protein [bacterium]
MEQCDYWMPDTRNQWCDLMNAACKCEGNEANCAIHGTSISSALKRQEQENQREECIRNMKKRAASQLS